MDKALEYFDLEKIRGLLLLEEDVADVDKALLCFCRRLREEERRWRFRKEKCDLVKELLALFVEKCGANVNYCVQEHGETAFWIVCWLERRRKVVELVRVLASGVVPADVMSSRVLKGDGILESPWHIAIENRNIDLMEVLLSLVSERGLEVFGIVFAFERNLLHLACLYGFDDCIAMILERSSKWNLNALDSTGHTALMYAIKGGHREMVNVLFDTKIIGGLTHDLSIGLGNRQTPLHLACAKEIAMDNVVQTLCQAKANVNAIDENGWSPLCLAVVNGHIITVETLIKFNANPNIKLRDGQSPLFLASMLGYGNIVNVLVDVGHANVTEEDDDGRTALHFAFQTYNILTRSKEGVTLEEKNAWVAHWKNKLEASGVQNLDYRFKMIEISDLNALIVHLLANGASLNVKDKAGEPAFSTPARFKWYDAHEARLAEIWEMLADPVFAEISQGFQDQRTQVAIDTKWVASGMRTRSLQRLFCWLLFVIMTLLVAFSVSTNANIQAVAVQMSLEQLFSDEWDEYNVLGFYDVDSVENYFEYVKNVVVPNLCDQTDVGRGLVLIGRPRIRALHYDTTSCGSHYPDVLSGDFSSCTWNEKEGSPLRSPESVADHGEKLLCGDGEEYDVPYVPGMGHVTGKFGRYSDSGYAIILPNNVSLASQLVDALQNCDHFVTPSTSLVVVEFTLYARAQQIFTHGQILLEMVPGGTVFPLIRWETRSFSGYSTTWDLTTFILWVIFYAYLLYSEVLLLTKEKWAERLIQTGEVLFWWNFKLMAKREASNLLVEHPKDMRILLGLPGRWHYLCAVRTQYPVPKWLLKLSTFWWYSLGFLFMICLGLTASLNSEWTTWQRDHVENTAEDRFVDVSSLMSSARHRQNVFASFAFLVVLMSLNYLKVSRSLAIPLYALPGMMAASMPFMGIVLVVISAFAFFEYIAQGLRSENNQTIYMAFVSAFRMALGDPDPEEEFYISSGDFLSAAWVTVATIVLCVLLMNTFIGVMSAAYDQTLRRAPTIWAYEQFGDLYRARELGKRHQKKHATSPSIHPVNNPKPETSK